MLALFLLAGSLFGSCIPPSVVADNLPYRLLGKIAVPNPAFVRVLECGLFTATTSLWITEFSAFKAGSLLAVDNITNYYPDFSQAKYAKAPITSLKWPNKINLAPAEFKDFLVVPDGFLIPWKESGGIYMVPVNCSGSPKPSAPGPIKLTKHNLEAFYHLAWWIDVNKDGRLDVVTARASVNPLSGGKGKGSLVWLEQPASDPLTTLPWQEHVIVEGPDILFEIVDFDTNDDYFVVIATEFFAQRLTLYMISFKNASVLATRVIDDQIGPAYCVNVVDLNMDGKRDLLVTNHVGGDGGAVYAYEVPDDLIHGNYTRHTLAANFTVTESGKNQAAPGFAFAVKPSNSYTGKPYILVAGDGSQKAYVLYPTDEDFQYTSQVILEADGVVGYIGFGNMIGDDGWNEFFVPDYDSGVVHAYTFAPSSP